MDELVCEIERTILLYTLFHLYFTTLFCIQLSVITDVPALDLVLQQLDNLDNLANISDILDLLFYVLVRLKEPSLKTIPPEAVSIHTLIINNNRHYVS